MIQIHFIAWMLRTFSTPWKQVGGAVKTTLLFCFERSLYSPWFMCLCCGVVDYYGFLLVSVWLSVFCGPSVGCVIAFEDGCSVSRVKQAQSRALPDATGTSVSVSLSFHIHTHTIQYLGKKLDKHLYKHIVHKRSHTLKHLWLPDGTKDPYSREGPNILTTKFFFRSLLRVKRSFTYI